MKISLSIVLVLTLSSIALAQPDDSPDVMGVFFDPNYPALEGSVPANVPFTAYVVLMNPTLTVMNGFEYGYDHWVSPVNESLVLRLNTNFPPGIIFINPPFDPFAGSYTIPLAEPVPLGAYNVLMSWDYILLADTFEIHFGLTGAENSTIPGGLPGYWDGTDVVPCGLAQTCWGTGSRMNAWCPLDTEQQSWGTLKGLYR